MKNGGKNGSLELELAAEDNDAIRTQREIENQVGVALPFTNRAELIALSKKLRTMADAIDAMVEPRERKTKDANGEPTFRFAAKVLIPDNFSITKSMYEYAFSEGFSDLEAQKIFNAFTDYYRKSGKKWQDWTAVWRDWIRRDAKQRATAPKQRFTTGGMTRW